MALVCSSEFSFSSLLLTVTSTLSFPSAAVCHEVPQEPVLSPASGRVFEKRLITKWVQDNGTDPVNGEPLSLDNLIAINGRVAAREVIMGACDTSVTFDPTADPLVKPRPPSATSIPAILKLLQDEWVSSSHMTFT